MTGKSNAVYLAFLFILLLIPGAEAADKVCIELKYFHSLEPEIVRTYLLNKEQYQQQKAKLRDRFNRAIGGTKSLLLKELAELESHRGRESYKILAGTEPVFSRELMAPEKRVSRDRAKIDKSALEITADVRKLESDIIPLGLTVSWGGRQLYNAPPALYRLNTRYILNASRIVAGNEAQLQTLFLMIRKD